MIKHFAVSVFEHKSFIFFSFYDKSISVLLLETKGTISAVEVKASCHSSKGFEAVPSCSTPNFLCSGQFSFIIYWLIANVWLSETVASLAKGEQGSCAGGSKYIISCLQFAH